MEASLGVHGHGLPPSFVEDNRETSDLR